MAKVTEQSWVSVKSITGGHEVLCRLCGSKRGAFRRFMAADTNYAEALRLATAFAWQHEHDAAHMVAVKAYRECDPTVTDEERVLSEIFGKPLPTKHELRVRAGRSAAAAVNPRRRKRGAR